MKDIALKHPRVNIRAKWEECVPAVLMLWQNCRWGFFYCMPDVAPVKGNILIDLWPSIDWKRQCLRIFEETESTQRTHKKANGALQHTGFLRSPHQSFRRVLVLNRHPGCCCWFILGIHFCKSKGLMGTK